MKLKKHDRKVTPAQIEAQAREIVVKKKLAVLKRFDTFKNTAGEKDVLSVEDAVGTKMILRVGEARPANFFPNGYDGNYLIVPRIFEHQEKDISYELEEYVEGKLVSELDLQASHEGMVSNSFLLSLIKAFWEFQELGHSLALEQKASKHEQHFKDASSLLTRPAEVRTALTSHVSFFETSFPSKWKFATDNLIKTPAGKIAFIDNVNVGLRPLGYDLGWLIWPRWVEMETKYYDALAVQMKYLEIFLNQVQIAAPDNIVRREGLDYQRIAEFFWMNILGRAVGAVSDVANNTRHLARWGMGPNDDPFRKQKHLQFLNALIEKVLTKLSSD